MAAPKTAAAMDAATNVLPTDEQILTQLATLQSLHSKIFQLRPLLPERLIDPVKAAVGALRSGFEPPAALAAHLQSVAVDGDKDVKEFKEQWRSEQMREVWRASKESSFPQGTDVWTVEYGGLSGGAGLGRAKIAEANVDEDAEKVFEKFKAEHPEIKIEMQGSGQGSIFADVTVGSQNFTITRSEHVEEAQPREWLITAKAGIQVTERLKQMLHSLQERTRKRSLSFLLVFADFLPRLLGILMNHRK